MSATAPNGSPTLRRTAAPRSHSQENAAFSDDKMGSRVVRIHHCHSSHLFGRTRPKSQPVHVFSCFSASSTSTSNLATLNLLPTNSSSSASTLSHIEHLRNIKVTYLFNKADQ